MFEIPTGLDPALIPLSVLIGSWSGSGVGRYRGTDRAFQHDLTITPVPGAGALQQVSRLRWLPVADPAPAGPEASDGDEVEAGFWRPGVDLTDVELVLADPAGRVAVLYGQMDGMSVQVGSDLVAATAGASRAAATGAGAGRVHGAATALRETRLYGRVGDGHPDLAYVVEVDLGDGMQPWRSARLSPRPDGAPPGG